MRLVFIVRHIQTIAQSMFGNLAVGLRRPHRRQKQQCCVDFAIFHNILIR